MTIKTAISLRKHIYNAGKNKANRLFGGNFSGYVSYLISRDMEENTGSPIQEKTIKKDHEIMATIDDILSL